jgi:hypothetical protein
MVKYKIYVKRSHATKEHPNGYFYLGRTERNPYNYKGSGIVWKQHLIKNNYTIKNIETWVLHETTSLDELKEVGNYYSKLFNIVQSDAWANLIDENGIGFDSKLASKLGKKNGKKQGKKNVDSGHLQNICVLGGLTTKGKITVNKGDIEKRVTLDELEVYLKDGWEKGRSKKSKNTISSSSKGNQIGEKNGMFGKGHLISGEKHGKSKKVKAYKTSEPNEYKIYSSTREAANILGVCQTDISKICNKKRHTAKGYFFEYIE